MRFTPPFKKKLAKKPVAMQGQILACIQRLREDPRHPGLHTHRVRGTDRVWEAYVDEANRVTFFWDGDRLVFEAHCNHDVLRRY